MSADLELALRAIDVADRITLAAFRRPSLAVETKADSSPVLKPTGRRRPRSVS